MVLKFLLPSHPQKRHLQKQGFPDTVNTEPRQLELCSVFKTSMPSRLLCGPASSLERLEPHCPFSASCVASVVPGTAMPPGAGQLEAGILVVPTSSGPCPSPVHSTLLCYECSETVCRGGRGNNFTNKIFTTAETLRVIWPL